MARIRSVKPELRTSQLVASWPVEVRYFWVLFWGYLDDYGRGIDSAKNIAGDCFPWDEKITAATIERWIRLIATKVNGEPGPICRYSVGGKSYLHAVHWAEHQRINRPSVSRFPPCPVHESLTEEFSEPFSESFTERFDVGAAEQGSRGAGEQQQAAREPITEPVIAPAVQRLLLEALEPQACTPAEALDVALAVQRTRKPKNLGGLLRTIAAAGELPALLAQVRADTERAAVKADLAAAKTGPECPHGVPGGLRLHRTSGRPICPQCRNGGVA